MEDLRKQPSRKARKSEKYVDEVELPEEISLAEPIQKKRKVKTGDFFKDTGRDKAEKDEAVEFSDYDEKPLTKRKSKSKAKEPLTPLGEFVTARSYDGSDQLAQIHPCLSTRPFLLLLNSITSQKVVLDLVHGMCAG